VSFIAGRWDEPNLIAVAYSLDQATHVRVPPQFLATFSFAASTKNTHLAPARGGAVAPDRFGRRGLLFR